jgi:hypothetical protein
MALTTRRRRSGRSGRTSFRDEPWGRRPALPSASPKVEQELEWQAQDLEMETAPTNIVTPAKEDRNFEIRRDPVGE